MKSLRVLLIGMCIWTASLETKIITMYDFLHNNTFDQACLNRAVLIKIWAPGSILSMMIQQSFEEVSMECNQTPVVFVDCSVNNDYCFIKDHFSIKMIPTIIALKNGVEIARLTGYQSKEKIKELAETLLQP